MAPYCADTGEPEPPASDGGRTAHHGFAGFHVPVHQTPPYALEKGPGGWEVQLDEEAWQRQQMRNATMKAIETRHGAHSPAFTGAPPQQADQVPPAAKSSVQLQLVWAQKAMQLERPDQSDPRYEPLKQEVRWLRQQIDRAEQEEWAKEL